MENKEITRISIRTTEELEKLFSKAAKVYEKKGLMFHGLKSQIYRQAIKEKLIQIIKKG